MRAAAPGARQARKVLRLSPLFVGSVSACLPLAPPPFRCPNETKRPKKIFWSLREFWAREHRRALGSCHSTLRLVEKFSRGCFALLWLLLLRFCLLFSFISLFYNYTILHYSQTSNLGFEKNQKGNSFITIRFYITLKRRLWQVHRPFCFITIRFYITLKPQTSNLRIDTLQYQESLYPYYTTRQQSESITTLFATFNLSFRSKQSR